MTIELQSVSVLINKKQLLNNINLSIKPNALTVIIGPNGAGKSTILKTCSGDMASTSGSVSINQQNLQTFTSIELAKTRAVMTQSYEMGFGFSVEEIVNMGCFLYEQDVCRQTQQDIVKEVMGFMNIEALASRNFMTLSGGEQQRTQLARVLTQLWYPYVQKEPRFLLLDEPTSSLDIFHQYQVLALAKQLTKRNIGVLAVVHDLSLAACFADQLILLSKGQTVAIGPPKTVLQRHYLSQVYGINAYYYQHSSDVMPSLQLEKVNQQPDFQF
jgi:iron complex transport system ATP-binding protein